MTERVLRFPADDQVARVYAYRGEACIVNAPALGEVRVPEDCEIDLHTLPPVRGLYDLAPDSIHRIEILKKSGTDDDLRHLSHLTGLRALRCSKSHEITDAGIAHIAGLGELRDLDLYWTSLTDASLATIGAMRHLTHLHLGLTQVKGPGVVHLARLQKLWRLSLENTDVDDSVVPVLATLLSLRRLVMWGTRLSVAGLAALRAALPQCSVEMRDPGRKLAEERRHRMLAHILVRRVTRGRAYEGDPREALARLLPDGSRIVAARMATGESGTLAKPRPIDGSYEDLMGLACLPMGLTLRIVTPAGHDFWIPWLRARKADRRGGVVSRRRSRHSAVLQSALLSRRGGVDATAFESLGATSAPRFD